MIHGRCLCGAHRFRLEPPLELAHHCHCGYCRKHHGMGYASLVGVPAERLEWTRGETIRYRSSPDFVRESCAICGTPLPQRIKGLPMFVPAGCLDDFEARFEFHIFAAHKAEWDPIRDGLPAFDEFPPGVAASAQPTKPALDPPGATRGSCLCGDVRFVVEGEGIAARHCHCGRCRKGRGAAHASSWMVGLDAFGFTAGADKVRDYHVPDAQFFTQSFCGRCGAKMPRVDSDREIAIVPLGALDDAPAREPSEHIFVADKPAWSTFQDDLPRHAIRGD